MSRKLVGIFLILIAISLFIFLITKLNSKGQAYYLIIVLGVYVFGFIIRIASILEQKEFYVFLIHSVISSLSVPLIFMGLINFFYQKTIPNDFSSFIVIMFTFILSLIILFLTSKIVKFFNLPYPLKRDTVNNLNLMITILTFLITVVIVLNSTFSSDYANYKIEDLNVRIEALENNVENSNSASKYTNRHDIDYSNTSLKDYYYLYVCIIIYVLASYYALLLLSRKKSFNDNLNAVTRKIISL